MAATLTKQELRLRWWLRIFAFSFTAETLVYLVPAIVGPSQEAWGELPFVANSFVKSALFGGICFLGAADVRRFDRAVSLLVTGVTVWCGAALVMLLFGETSKEVSLLGAELTMTAILWLGIAFEGAIAVLFAILHRSAFRSRYDVRFFSAGQFRTLTSVAEALLWTSPAGEGPPPELSPEEVATNADHYLAGFDAGRKSLMRLALVGINLYPLAFFRPPFNLMAADERRQFLEKHFGDDVAERRIGSRRRWLVQAMIRLAQQVVYLGFYGDRRTWPGVGYIPFSERPEGAKAHQARKKRGGLRVESGLTAGDVAAEVVIVGSGAAGAVIGYRLAEAGHDVLLIERGRHVDPADFTEDEIEMLGTLYRDGAVQLARDFKLQVLQGMCVGGTTVINNAVSIPPPEAVLEEWVRRSGGSFDPGRVAPAVETIKKLLKIERQPDAILNPGAGRFLAGIEKLGLVDRARRYEPVDANISGCLGCGYCNIGCAYGRKLSMLDTLLPWAQGEFGGRLRILAETQADGVEADGDRVTAIHCKAGRRRFRVRGERFVVAAGAISSSYLLGRSGLGGPRVGRALSFNVGSTITAEFDEKVDSFAGLQISHVFEPPLGGPDVVMETWYNPVVSQSLAMPGWFEQHRRNMRAYDRMAATGVLIGTESNGRVEKALFGGADVVYTPTVADLARLVEGLKLCAEIYLAADAKRVMPATFRFRSYSREEQLGDLDRLVRTNEDIQLGTGHPQGGNSFGADPSAGPVDPVDFRVHGTSNLHLCDASVFPTSLGVNPQLTTMALAEVASGEIIARLR